MTTIVLKWKRRVAGVERNELTLEWREWIFPLDVVCMRGILYKDPHDFLRKVACLAGSFSALLGWVIFPEIDAARGSGTNSTFYIHKW